MRLIDDITLFLEGEGFECSRQMRDGFDVICTKTLCRKYTRIILPLEVSAGSEDDAVLRSEAAYRCVRFIRSHDGFPLVIPEDRWNRQKGMMQARLLSHLELFAQAYARNCEVRRIEKSEAKAFLDANHSYGYAACKYRYGLFLKRQTGHLAREFQVKPGMTEGKPEILVAVATFSNARKWRKGEKEIRSYEWTRFASLPGMRISGGMGKMLKAFVDEVKPDDVMSYADLEWSEGAVYETLGFQLEGMKTPVMFAVDVDTWQRLPLRNESGCINLFFRNFGSNKYRLKLTDYE